MPMRQEQTCSHAKQAETDDRAEESNYDRYARNINEQYIQLKEVARLYCNDKAVVLFRIE